MFYTGEHPLGGERRRRRQAEARRCVAVAVNAQSEPLAAAMIDEAVRLRCLELVQPASS